MLAWFWLFARGLKIADNWNSDWSAIIFLVIIIVIGAIIAIIKESSESKESSNRIKDSVRNFAQRHAPLFKHYYSNYIDEWFVELPLFYDKKILSKEKKEISKNGSENIEIYKDEVIFWLNARVRYIYNHTSENLQSIVMYFNKKDTSIKKIINCIKQVHQKANIETTINHNQCYISDSHVRVSIYEEDEEIVLSLHNDIIW